MENSVNMEPGKTRIEASREIQDMEVHEPFSIGSEDSVVGQSTDNRESWSLASVQETWSRGFQLFDKQSIVRQPQPGQQFQPFSDNTEQSPTEGVTERLIIGHRIE